MIPMLKESHRPISSLGDQCIAQGHHRELVVPVGEHTLLVHCECGRMWVEEKY